MTMKFCPMCGSDLIDAEIDGFQRRACSAEGCDYVFWDNPTPVVAAIVERGGQVILVRNKGWPDKMFGLVTGFLEKGETPDEGVIREVKEELGLDGRVERFVGYYAFDHMNQLILAFHVKVEGPIVLGDELEEIKELPPERLRPWRFGTGYAVSDWLAHRSELK
jgi:NADH pyrophosphatase NudC (nudix superfamily)